MVPPNSPPAVPALPGPEHFLRFAGPVTNIHEAPAIGNGDLAALVQVFHNEFRLHLGKNDIWDARFDHITADHAITQGDLIRASRDYGFRLEGANYRASPAWDREPADIRYPLTPPGWFNPYPCPKPAGWIRVLHSGISSTRIETTVDIARGVVCSTFDYDNVWHAPGRLVIEAFVDRLANAVRLRIRRQGNVGEFHLCVEKRPDSVDPSIPWPESRLAGPSAGIVTQRIPAGFDVPEFAWSLAAAFPETRAGIRARRPESRPCHVRQVVTLDDGAALEFMVGVATDRDGGGDAASRAVGLAGPATPDAYDRTFAAHAEDWRAFWSRSGISLDDRELEQTWYRNLFALAAHIGPKAQAPGLCANVVPHEESPWHGGYTVNMNIQKMFLSSLPANHPEWIDCYAGWIDHMRPSFEHLARTLFGLEGVYSPHMVMPYVPPHRQANSNEAGRALGMTGWHGQPLWWRWEHTQDREFLARRAYPYIRDAAAFYWRYFEKYMDESGDIYPSLNLEAPPWTRHFEHNRDCFIDLILFRQTFMEAIAASEILGVDAEWRERWRAALARVRPLTVDHLEDGSSWIRADKNDGPPPAAPGKPWWEERRHREAQALAAAWSVFPGEYIEGDEPDGFAAVARDTMQRTRWHELHPAIIWIHHWWCAIPALRMGLPHAFELARTVILRERFPAGHARTTHWINMHPDAWRCPEDNYLGVAATTEMLLQSQGEVLRIFPAWPKDRAARFRGLSARGGFVVDASWDPEAGLAASIRSLAGRPCRIRCPAGDLPRIGCGSDAVPARRDGRDVVFPTAAGAVYDLHAGRSE